MWCFFDESFHDGENPVTAVAACLMHDETVRGLDIVLYGARRDHFGIDHARDLTRELKGKDLFSAASFKQMEKYGNNNNLAIATQILSKCEQFREKHPIWIFGAVVYGTVGLLTRLGSTRLERPLASMLDNVSAAASQEGLRKRVNVVFDSQLCGAEPHMAVAVRRFVAGVKLKNVSHFPLVGVSNVTPGIQLADICAHVLRRDAIGDSRVAHWRDRIMGLQWAGQINGYSRTGIQWWHKNEANRLVVCAKREKEQGNAGQALC